jgi:hypothetical protein
MIRQSPVPLKHHSSPGLAHGTARSCSRRRKTIRPQCQIVPGRFRFTKIVIVTILVPALTLGLRAENPPHHKTIQPGSDRTYTSPAFGFSYTYPIQLIRNTADFRHKLGPHIKGQRTTLVLFSAYETPSSTIAREGVVIMAVDASYFGGLRDGADYLHRATVALERQGWVVLRQEVPLMIDGHRFFRSDYVFRQKSSPIFESSVCTIRGGYALDFVLTGGSTLDIEQLFRSLSTVHFEKTP